MNNECCRKTYQYTKDGDHLTTEQRDFFEENGYIVIPKLIDSDLLDECKQRFIDYCDQKLQTAGVTYMNDAYLKKKGYEGQYAMNRIHHIYFDSVLSKYVTNKALLDVVQSIIGTSNISCCHSIFLNKPPNSEIDSSRHPMHQDLYFLPYRPENSIIATWTALEKVTVENGCLFLVPKSHKLKLKQHEYPENINTNSFYTIPDFKNFTPINVPMEKGDTVFFHPLVLHGSNPNLTQGFRKSMACHFVDSNCNIIELTDEKTKRDQEELSLLWGYGKSDYQLFWKKKTWVARGLPGNINKVDSKL
ncbi:hypothetical protein RN001_013550 [Aquatica leii]|uniref:phytanoyl-CoA dioxygenase n=1 Tax=Aquatica leii TaxID=1421715 RepID=A0AAN7PZY3_9COLE|nr:hypothetical protein RN001_013550 [Aquatica leii]